MGRPALTDARHRTDPLRPHDGATVRAVQRQSLHADDPVARAMARRILARVGIPPLLAVLVMLGAMPQTVDAQDRQGLAVRATATARAVIVTDSARLSAGRVARSARLTPDPRDISPPPLQTERPCELPHTSRAPCRMIVIHLP